MSASSKRVGPRRLSAADFGQAVASLRLSPQNVEAARRVMVDRDRTVDVADECGLTRQVITKAVTRIYESHLAILAAPPDWETVTVTVPKPVAEEVRGLEANARREHLRR